MLLPTMPLRAGALRLLRTRTVHLGRACVERKAQVGFDLNPWLKVTMAPSSQALTRGQ
jgi:hypothetical protein